MDEQDLEKLPRLDIHQATALLRQLDCTLFRMEVVVKKRRKITDSLEAFGQSQGCRKVKDVFILRVLQASLEGLFAGTKQVYEKFAEQYQNAGDLKS